MLGSSFSVRSVLRFGSVFSFFGLGRLSASASVLDSLRFGSSLSVRSAVRFGRSLSIYGLVYLQNSTAVVVNSTAVVAGVCDLGSVLGTGTVLV